LKKYEIYYSDIETTKFKDNIELVNISEYILDYKLGCIIKFDSNSKIDYKYHSFSQLEFNKELIKYKPKQLKIVYFHNLKFDSKFFFKDLVDTFDKVIPIRAGNLIINISCYIVNSQNKYNKVLEFKDSYALTITSLKLLGKMVNKPKMEFDFNYSTKEGRELGVKYCYRDCKIIYYAIIYLIKFIYDLFEITYEIYQLPLTIGSFAKKIFISIYSKVFYQVDFNIEKSLRKYYYGGRTECFDFNINYEVISFDFNSLYPSVLSKQTFSEGKVIKSKTNEINFSNPLILAFKCSIIENQFYPLYPSRDYKRVIFKNGFKKVIITKIEYDYFVKNNMISDSKNSKNSKNQKQITIIKVHSCYIGYPISFPKYFESLYYKRKTFEINHPYNHFCKKFMNSCYGKFGQKIENKSIQFLKDLKIKDIEKDDIYELNGFFYKEVIKINKWLKINLLNAILSTSYSRFKLWKLLQFCYQNNILVIYCDTDSIYIKHYDSYKLDKFIDDIKLGKLKLEYSVDIFLCIDSKEYICKNYDKTYMIKFKGIKKEYMKDFSDLKRHIKEGTNTNLIGSIFYCIRRNSNLQSVHIINKQKHKYFLKRIVLNDYSTIPFTDIIDTLQISKNKRLILNQLSNLSKREIFTNFFQHFFSFTFTFSIKKKVIFNVVNSLAYFYYFRDYNTFKWNWNNFRSVI